MGIRIHKALGWGLTDVKHENGRLIDERFNRDGIMFAEDEEQWNYESFLEWGKKQGNPELEWNLKEIIGKRNVYKHPLSYHFIYAHEFGLSNVFCVANPCLPDSIRYDDIIDWVQETYFQGSLGGGGRVDLLPENIYPYSRQWWDTRDGRELPSREIEAYTTFIRPKEYGNLPDLLERKLRLVSKMGFKSNDEFNTYAAPRVPINIINQIEYTKVFNDPKTIYQMRPMLYTYWS